MTYYFVFTDKTRLIPLYLSDKVETGKLISETKPGPWEEVNISTPSTSSIEVLVIFDT